MLSHDNIKVQKAIAKDFSPYPYLIFIAVMSFKNHLKFIKKL